RTDRSLFDALVEAARTHGWSRIAIEDLTSGAVSYRKLLIGAHVVGRKLQPLSEAGEAVGLMVPNANGAAVAIFALIAAGRVPAMINFTAGAANILAGCASAKVKTLITSRGFVEKGKL